MSHHKPPSESQLRIIWFAITALAVTAIVTVTAAFIWGAGKVLALLSPVIWPLAIAAVLAYLLDPAVYWLERKKISRPKAIVIVFVTVFCVFGGIMASVIPQLVEETNQLISKIPGYTAHAQQKIERWADRADKAAAKAQQQATNSVPAETNANDNASTATNRTPAPASASAKESSSKKPEVAGKNNSPTANSQTNATAGGGESGGQGNQQIHKQLLSSAKDWLSQAVPKVGNLLFTLVGKITSLVDVVIALILIPIYCFYFLREKREIKSQWANYLPIRDSHVKDEMVYMLEAVNQYLIAFFRGQVLVALINGALYTIGFLCIGLDYAFLLGFLAFILTIIPFIGAIITGILAMALAMVEYGDWLHPLLVVVVFTVVQSLESFFYSPKIMGNRVGLHPVVVIIAVMIGVTVLGGFLGGILAIPVAAALRVVLFRYVWRKPEPPRPKIAG